ncbi:NADP(H)-dependent aldo-keto reductase [Burkholderia stagnalis]
MHYRKLGRTGLDVSAIGLGTMTWGEQTPEAQAHEQIDCALEHGVNFIDTAEMYPVPASADTHGLTERYIGNWLGAHPGARERLVLATKVIGPARQLPGLEHIRGGDTRLDRSNLKRALEASLTRLRTDYIDLYQLHWPDRVTTNFGRTRYPWQDDAQAVPIEETLAVLGEFVAAGLVRHIGLSNETPWGVARFLAVAEQRGLPRIATIQNPYSLLNRTFESGLSEFSHRDGIGLIANSPLAFGLLSGKYEAGRRPAGARLTLFERFHRYGKPQAIWATARYVELAKRYGVSPATLALSFVNSRPFVASTLIGATSLDQLKENISSVDIGLSPEMLAEIDALHELQPNPAP